MSFSFDGKAKMIFNMFLGYGGGDAGRYQPFLRKIYCTALYRHRLLTFLRFSF